MADMEAAFIMTSDSERWLRARMGAIYLALGPAREIIRQLRAERDSAIARAEKVLLTLLEAIERRTARTDAAIDRSVEATSYQDDANLDDAHERGKAMLEKKHR